MESGGYGYGRYGDGQWRLWREPLRRGRHALRLRGAANAGLAAGAGELAERGAARNRARGAPAEIEGELVAASTAMPSAAFPVGQRVFHQKFGYGTISEVEGTS